VIIANAELSATAEHAVGGNALHLAFRNSEVAGQYRADWSQRYVIPNSKVHGATDNLQRSTSGVDDDATNAIGPFNGVNFIYASGHNVTQACAHFLNAFDNETKVIQRVTKESNVDRERHEFA
jgi:hypothetical protein